MILSWIPREEKGLRGVRSIKTYKVTQLGTFAFVNLEATWVLESCNPERIQVMSLNFLIFIYERKKPRICDLGEF